MTKPLEKVFFCVFHFAQSVLYSAFRMLCIILCSTEAYHKKDSLLLSRHRYATTALCTFKILCNIFLTLFSSDTDMKRTKNVDEWLVCNFGIYDENCHVKQKREKGNDKKMQQNIKSTKQFIRLLKVKKVKLSQNTFSFQ